MRTRTRTAPIDSGLHFRPVIGIAGLSSVGSERRRAPRASRTRRAAEAPRAPARGLGGHRGRLPRRGDHPPHRRRGQAAPAGAGPGHGHRGPRSPPGTTCSGRWPSSWSTWRRSTTTTSWTRPPCGATSRASTPASGNLVAIVAGDFLLARSAEIAAVARHRDRRPAGRHPGRAVPGPGGRGALRLPDRAQPRTTTSTAIAGKTASLMATSCRIGALTGGLPRDRGRRPHRLRALASAWSSRSATTSST